MADSKQPMRARGRARVAAAIETGRRVATITLSRGNDIGFAVGAMNATGFRVVAAEPRVVTVLVGRRRLTSITRGLEAVGFTVQQGDDR